MTVTVAEALERGMFKEAKVVAGFDGLNNVITNAGVMETPNVGERMRGGEFILCAGYAIKSDPQLQKDIIIEFAEKKVGAFGIQLGSYFKSIPGEMKELANEYGLPLLELPENYFFMDFLMPFYEIIVNQQIQTLRYTDEMHFLMIETMLSEGGIDGIVKVVYSHIKKPLVLLDVFGNVMYYREQYLQPEKLFALGETYYQEIKKMRNPKHDLEKKIYLLTAADMQEKVAFIPLKVGDMMTGYLLIIEEGEAVSELDHVLIKEAALLLELEMLKEKKILEAEISAKSDLLEDVISGSYRNPKVMIRRGKYMNINLSARMMVFYMAFKDRTQISSEEEFQSRSAEKIGILMNAVYKEYEYSSYDVIVTKYGYGVIGLLTFDERTSEEDLTRKFKKLMLRCKSLKKLKRDDFIISFGHIVKSVDDVKHSYMDAINTFKTANYFGTFENIINVKNIDIYLLLFELKNSDLARKYYEKYISGIVQYDLKHQGELMKTLQIYYSNNKNIKLTAEQLFVHNNTVSYRLKKISELAGVNFDHYRESLMMELLVLLAQVVFSPEE